jgi:hypothetical protein
MQGSAILVGALHGRSDGKHFASTRERKGTRRFDKGFHPYCFIAPTIAS